MPNITIENFDYLIINTAGYTSRLINRIGNLEKDIFDNVYLHDCDKNDDDYPYKRHSVLYIKDSQWIHRIYYYGNREEIEFVEKYTKKLDGFIVFKCRDLSSTFSIINLLKNEYKFCNCFGPETISKIKLINGILIIDIDAESG